LLYFVPLSFARLWSLHAFGHCARAAQKHSSSENDS
jgi:hypothetical protein